ncbi:YihY/virulence factor BrkB family protein [Gramella sp. BOM4]|nr:YihY/virulence factor BrkB family protein [Christiangramia bathymodioli]
MGEQVQNEVYSDKKITSGNISISTWKHLSKNILKQLKTDHVQIVSAGVAFYFFLAIFPAIAALLALYSLAFDPAKIQDHLSSISATMPEQVFGILNEVITSSLEQSQEALGWGLVISILLSIWSANKGTSAIFEGVNIAYNTRDTRGFIKKTLLSLSFTFGTVLLGIIGVGMVIVFPGLIDKLQLPGVWKNLIGISRWIIMGLLLIFFMAAIYKIAPCRKNSEFRWRSLGAILATVLWLGGSMLFSWYVENFGSYGEAYGSFAAVIILLLWFFLFSFIVLLGAEVNSEIEKYFRSRSAIVKEFANHDHHS